MKINKILNKLAFNLFLFFAIFINFAKVANAGDINIAVSANFYEVMKIIAAKFEKESSQKVIISSGASGKLYTQIIQGAPFHIFFSADQITVAKLESAGLALPGSRFTYAIGKIVLWSRKKDFIDAQGEILKTNKFNKIALANPKTAPYGVASYEVLAQLGLLDKLQNKIVSGNSIGQTFQFVFSGNAQLGFVSYSQIINIEKIKDGSTWIIPTNLYSPIKQDAVLLLLGKNDATAISFIEYIKSESAKEIIKSFGYDTK